VLLEPLLLRLLLYRRTFLPQHLKCFCRAGEQVISGPEDAYPSCVISRGYSIAHWKTSYHRSRTGKPIVLDQQESFVLFSVGAYIEAVQERLDTGLVASQVLWRCHCCRSLANVVD